MAKLSSTQHFFLGFLREETDPENPQNFIELTPEENRTARALERKGLVEIQAWGDKTLAARIKVERPKKSPEERIAELEAALAPFAMAAVSMEPLEGDDSPVDFTCTVPPVEAFRKAQKVLKS